MKMKNICKLEERHGTDLRAGYKNDHSCVIFISYQVLLLDAYKVC